ncbi:MAG: hypothetical protein ACOCYO_05755 [Bacteroidota bacterium]
MKNTLYALLAIAILSFATSSFAQVYQTVQSGQWTNTSTWENGNIPPKKQNNITIRINKGHDVLFQANAKDHEMGNKVTMIIDGNFYKNSWGDFKIGEKAEIFVNGLFEINNNPLSIGNNAVFHINGNFNMNHNFTSGNKMEINIAETGSMSVKQTFETKNNLVMNVEGSFENTAGGGFTAGANTFLRVTENASYTSTTSSSFEDQLLMIVDGAAIIDGWNFSFGQGSEIKVLGTLNVTNDWVFKSGNSDNVFYACEDSVNNPDYINDVIYLDCDVLPVELLYFEARTDASNDVLLTWATASETNSDYFIIERSTDAQNWTALETVQSAGNSNYLIEYSYTDTDTQSGIYYYRLVQTDFDGAFEIFESIAVEKESLTTFEIYNVYRSQRQVVIQGNFQANNRVMVTDLMGNVYFQGALSTDQSQISFRIDSKVSAIVVKLTDGSKRESAYSKKFFI